MTLRRLAEAFGTVTGTPPRTTEAPPARATWSVPAPAASARPGCSTGRAEYALEDGIRHALKRRSRPLEPAAEA